MTGLNEKQRLFCKYYVNDDFNALSAAIRAGYSVKIARDAAGLLLKRDDINAEIRRCKCEHTAYKILTDVTNMCTGAT